MGAETEPPASAPAQEGGLALRLAAYVCFGIAVGAPAAQSWSALRFLPGDSFVGQFLVEPIIVIGTVALARILWAPFLDAYRPPFLHGLGRRRGWVANLLVLLALFSIAVALTLPSGSDPLANGPAYPILYVLALLTAGGLLAAVDGLRSVEPGPRSHGLLAAVQNIAPVVPAVVVLILFGRVDSPGFLWVSIALLAVGLVGLWLLPATASAENSGISNLPRVRRFLDAEHNFSGGAKALLAWLYGALVCPILDFFDRHGPAAWLALLVLVLGDFATSAISLGKIAALYEATDITAFLETIGRWVWIAQFAGFALAAYFVWRFSPVVGLAAAMAVAAVGLCLSALAIVTAPATAPLAVAYVFGTLAYGTTFIATVVFIARLVAPRFAAFQFSLLWICAIPNIVKPHLTNALEGAAGLLGSNLIQLALAALSIGLTLQLARMLEAPSSPRG